MIKSSSDSLISKLESLALCPSLLQPQPASWPGCGNRSPSYPRSKAWEGLLLVWGPTVCWELMRSLGFPQSFIAQESGCKASRNGSHRARVPSPHAPEHQRGLQEKGQSLDRALGRWPGPCVSVHLTLSSGCALLVISDLIWLLYYCKRESLEQETSFKSLFSH